MTTASTPFLTSPVLQRAEQYIHHLFLHKKDPHLVFHNFSFAHTLVETCRHFTQVLELEETEREGVQIAAWFLYSGKIYDYLDFTPYSLQEARKFLQAEDYPEKRAARILQWMHKVLDKHPPLKQYEAVLLDALTVATFLVRANDRLPLWQLERHLKLGMPLDKQHWTAFLQEQLRHLVFYTSYAQVTYGENLAKLLQQQYVRLQKANAESQNTEHLAGTPPLFNDLDTGNPTKPVQTFFRANYRNHINLSAIADNKANIMISVNSILISVLISILTYRNLSQTNPMILLPIVIFLVTGLASLIFAVLSARPKVTNVNKNLKEALDSRHNVVFFGNFVHLKLEEYEAAMDRLFRDPELLYGNMTRDLYYLGKVLEKKYRFLTISYNIFMLGFIATVSTFLFVLLT